MDKKLKSIRALLLELGKATVSTDIEESHAITLLWLDAAAMQLGFDMVLHLHDHQCTGATKMQARYIDYFKERVAVVIADGCENLKFNNPFVELTHNQKLVAELLKQEQENGQ